MKRIIRWGVENSPAVNTVMIGVLLVGLISMLSMRREAFPEFDRIDLNNVNRIVVNPVSKIPSGDHKEV